MVAAAVAEEAESAGAWQAGVKEARSGDAEEPKGLRDAYRARRIRPGQLTGPSKRLVQLAIAQIMLVAVLMAAQKVHQPQVTATCRVRRAARSRFRLSCSLSWSCRSRPDTGSGWPGPCEFARAWASRSPRWPPGRWPTCRSRAFVSVAPPSTRTCPTLDCAGRSLAPSRSSGSARRHDGSGVARAAQEARGRSGAGRPAMASGDLPCLAGRVLAYCALEFAIWGCTRRLAWPRPVPARCSRISVSRRSWNHILGPRGPLGSTDLLEWGEIAVQSIVVGTKGHRPRWLLVILTLLAALATIANVVRLDGIGIVLELAVLSVPAVFLAALVRLAPGYGYWSDDLGLAR